VRSVRSPSGCHWSPAVRGGDQCSVSASCLRRFALCALNFALCLSVLLLSAPPCLAQDPDDDPAAEADAPFGWEDSARRRYPLDIQRAEILAFARAVPLSPDQREAALRLYDAYRARHRAAAEKMFEYETAITSGDRDRAWSDETLREKLEPVQIEFHTYQQKIKDELVGNIRDLLTPEQAHSWSWLERRLRLREAEMVLSHGRVRSADLSILIEDVLPSTQSPQGTLDLLERYAADLDALLREARTARDEFMRNAADARQQKQEGEDAQDSWMQMQLSLRPFRQKALELEDAFLARLRTTLSPAQADDLERRVLEERVGGAWGLSDFNRLFNSVDRLRDLSAEQREALAAERKSAQEKRLEFLREFSKKLREFNEADPGDFDYSIYQKLHQEASERRAETVSRLRAILTEPQREAVGPPLAKSRLVAIDFDDEDAPIPPPPDLPRQMPSFLSRGQSPVISETDIPVLTRTAALTPDQAAAARDLVEVYVLRLRTAVRRVQVFEHVMMAEMMRSRGDPDESAFKPVLQSISRFLTYKQRISREVQSELRDLLTPEQQPGLERVFRAARRRQAMQTLWGMDWLNPSAGVETDRLLTAALEGAPPPPEIDAIFDRYEIDAAPMVDVIVRINDAMIEHINAAAEADDVMEKMQEAETQDDQRERKMHEASARLADLNARTVDQIARTLPAEPREAFEDAYFAAVTDAAFDSENFFDQGPPRTPEGLADNALHLKDITDDQRAALGAALRDHRRSVREINKRLAAVMSENAKKETDPSRRHEVMMSEEVGQLQNKRREASQESLKRLSAILTEHQRAQLPPPYRPPGAIPRPVFDD